MIIRSFLSGVGALLARKVIVVRDKPAPPSAPTRSTASDEETARRERAAARLILRRVGIAPLASALALVVVPAPLDDLRAQTAPVRTTATARAVILPSSARIQQGRITVTGTRADTVSPVIRPVERSCDAAALATPVAETAQAPCRMIVYDLP